MYQYSDPESAHTSKFNIYYLQYKDYLVRVRKNKYVYLYLKLVIFISFVLFLRNLIPSEYVSANNVLIGTSFESYTRLGSFTPYRTILDSRELRNKYSKSTSISPVVHPKNMYETSIDVIRFKKEFNLLKSELKKTLRKEQLTCIPAIALGLGYNIILDDIGNMYMNVKFFNKSDANVDNVLKHNVTININGLFDVDEDPEDIRVYEKVVVKYIDPVDLVLKTTELAALQAYCIQYYLRNFDFKELDYLKDL